MGGLFGGTRDEQGHIVNLPTLCVGLIYRGSIVDPSWIHRRSSLHHLLAYTRRQLAVYDTACCSCLLARASF